MKLLLVAPCSQPEMTGNLIAKALINMGLRFELFDYRQYGKEHNIPKMNLELRKILGNLPANSIVLFLKAETIWPESLSPFRKILKVLWHWDFNSFAPQDSLMDFGKEMNKVFLMCYPWVEILRKNGINAFWLPQATDPTIYSKKKPLPYTEADIFFPGSFKPGRLEIIRSLMDNNFSVLLKGNGWSAPVKPAYLSEFSSCCSTAKLTLNITPSRQWPIYSYTFSQRVYMVLASEGCLVTDNIPGLEYFFIPDHDFVIWDFKDYDFLRSLIKDKKKRSEIGRNGRRSILQRHTYVHRLQEMFTCLGHLPSVLKNTLE